MCACVPGCWSPRLNGGEAGGTTRKVCIQCLNISLNSSKERSANSVLAVTGVREREHSNRALIGQNQAKDEPMVNALGCDPAGTELWQVPAGLAKPHSENPQALPTNRTCES